MPIPILKAGGASPETPNRGRDGRPEHFLLVVPPVPPWQPPGDRGSLGVALEKLGPLRCNSDLSSQIGTKPAAICQALSTRCRRRRAGR